MQLVVSILEANREYTSSCDTHGQKLDEELTTKVEQLLKESRVTHACICIIGHVMATPDLKPRADKVRSELLLFRKNPGYEEHKDFPKCMSKIITAVIKEKKVPGA